MSIQSEYAPSRHTVSSGTSEYAFNFKTFSEDDLVAIIVDADGVETTLELGTDYSVSGVLLASGSITLDAPEDYDGETLVIKRVIDITQTSSFVNAGSFRAEDHERAFDRLTAICQQQQDEVDRSLKTAETSTGFDPTLPTLLTPGYAIGINEDGTGLVLAPNTGVDMANELAAMQDSIDGLDSDKADLSALAASSGSGLIGHGSHLTVASKLSEFISVKDYGAKGDGSTNDTAAIQAALTYCAAHGKCLWIPNGVYLVSTTLVMGTACRIVGESMAGAIIKMSALPAGSKPTYTGSTSYTPTLSYFPILWNAAPIQWYSIENLTLHGNDLNVYGLRLQEHFYGELRNVLITRCNKAPFISVRGQSIKAQHLVIYQNKAGMILLDNTSFDFDTCGYERIYTSGNVVEVRTPASTKSGVSFRDCWFEDDADWPTTGCFMAVSGRNPVVDGGYFASVGTPHALKCIGAADTLTFDGISNANDCGAINGRFVINCATASMPISFSSDSYANKVAGSFDGTLVTDSNGGNVWYRALSTTAPLTRVSDSPVILRSSTAEYFKIDPATSTMTLWGNANNYIKSNSGVLEMKSNAGLRHISGGGDFELLVQHQASTNFRNFYFSTQSGTCNWQQGHPVFGAYHLWVDGSGKLRIKSGAPTSDTDGTIVGTQS